MLKAVPLGSDSNEHDAGLVLLIVQLSDGSFSCFYNLPQLVHQLTLQEKISSTQCMLRDAILHMYKQTTFAAVKQLAYQLIPLKRTLKPRTANVTEEGPVNN